MKFELTILGCNSAIPANGRHPTSQLLQVQNHSYLIDCGEGTQMRMSDFKIKRGRINQIFISHLHGDHYLGLFGLLNSFNLMGRETPMTIFAPAGLSEIVDAHIEFAQMHPFKYPVKFEQVDTTKYQKIFEDDLLEVFSIPLNHRIPTSGYLFKEKPHPKNIDSEKIKEYQISIENIKKIKKGGDLVLENGTIIPNKDLVKAVRPRKSFAFCSDTVYDESIIPYVQNVNMLYHEATYMHKDLSLAVDHKHTTAQQAAMIAKKAKVGKLILGHYSSRYVDLEPLLMEAKKVFGSTYLAVEGESYSYNE